jgi:benzoyl-CoA reductase/2-hydroxyglutaryl-CoA dehydratase subunit BcrC/BadD/HgdB
VTAIKLLNRPGSSKKRYIDPQAMVEGVRKYLEAQDGNFQLKSTARYLQLVAENIEQALHAKENGNFYAVHSAQFPIELLRPIGVMPLSSELYSTVVGIIGNGNAQFLSISDDIGFPGHISSYCRSFYGMVEVGAWPVPDFICYVSSPCDQAPKGHEMAAKQLGVSSFGLDRPYKMFTPQSMNYWLEQHHALIRFLEEKTGRKMNHDQLQEVVRLSYRATQVYLEINELRRAVPSPLPAEAAFAPMAVYRAWAGTQKCIDFLEQLRDELKGRVSQGLGAVPRERFRYTCPTSLPLFDVTIMTEMEKRHGAVNVMDHLQWWREDGDWLLDLDDPIASLAYRSQFGADNSLYSSAMNHAEEVRLAAFKCNADGVVYFNDFGCQHAAGGYRIFKDTVEGLLGLPWLTIDCDMLDKSFTSFNEVMSQLDTFFGQIENNERYQIKMRQSAKQSGARIVTA